MEMMLEPRKKLETLKRKNTYEIDAFRAEKCLNETKA